MVRYFFDFAASTIYTFMFLALIFWLGGLKSELPRQNGHSIRRHFHGHLLSGDRRLPLSSFMARQDVPVGQVCLHCLACVLNNIHIRGDEQRHRRIW